VDDEQFGQRRQPFVVLKDGAAATPESTKTTSEENWRNIQKCPGIITILERTTAQQHGRSVRRELQDRAASA